MTLAPNSPPTSSRLDGFVVVTQSQDAPNILRPRRTPAQQRSRERYARMLSSARTVLIEHGFESFTFDEVARIADIPIGTLYMEPMQC